MQKGEPTLRGIEHCEGGVNTEASLDLLIEGNIFAFYSFQIQLKTSEMTKRGTDTEGVGANTLREKCTLYLVLILLVE